jgi:hypothetical protein
MAHLGLHRLGQRLRRGGELSRVASLHREEGVLSLAATQLMQMPVIAGGSANPLVAAAPFAD